MLCCVIYSLSRVAVVAWLCTHRLTPPRYFLVLPGPAPLRRHVAAAYTMNVSRIRTVAALQIFWQGRHYICTQRRGAQTVQVAFFLAPLTIRKPNFFISGSFDDRRE